MTGVGFEPTPPKRRELESPALDHSAIQPWPRPRRTAAGQLARNSRTAPSRGTRPNSLKEIKKEKRGREAVSTLYNNESENAKAESQAIDATRHL